MSKTKDLSIDIENARSQYKHLTWESALVAAQLKMKGVAKDSTNTFHQFKYASADDVIAASRVALNGEGLAVVRSWKITVNELGVWVDSDFVLVHEGGTTTTFSACSFPALEGKGRPLDRAIAISLTSSLGYFLRDLLLIPKPDDESMDRRDDTLHQPVERKKLEMAGAVALTKRLKKDGLDINALIAAMESAMNTEVGTDLARWDSAWLSRIDRWIEKQMTANPKEREVKNGKEAKENKEPQLAGAGDNHSPSSVVGGS